MEGNSVFFGSMVASLYEGVMALFHHWSKQYKEGNTSAAFHYLVYANYWTFI